MKTSLIAGLGNPGLKYIKTRHNIGFLVLAVLAQDLDAPGFLFEKKFKSEVAKVQSKEQKVLLVKPETFMNLSGQAIQQAIDYYDISLENLLIIQDDVDLPFGSLRFSNDSSAGGHNGIKSIIYQLGTQEFTRLRIGVANELFKEKNIPSEKFVLADFNSEEQEQLKKEIIPQSVKAAKFWLDNGFEKAATEYN